MCYFCHLPILEQVLVSKILNSRVRLADTADYESQTSIFNYLLSFSHLLVLSAF